MKHKMDICFTSDENYVQHMAVAIASILKNADTDDVFSFWVVDDNISANSKEEIEKLKFIKSFEIHYISIDKKAFQGFPRRWDGLSLNSYYLIKVPNFLKNKDKLLFLDCDIVVRKSLYPLFSTDVEYILAAEDMHHVRLKQERQMPEESFYFNSGVFLLNCKRWREELLEVKCFEYVKNKGHEFVYQDQEVLNGVFCGKVKKMELTWNFQYIANSTGDFDELYFNETKRDPAIIHYISGSKPWKLSYIDKVSFEYWKYLIITPFYVNDFKFLFEELGANRAENISVRLRNEFLKSELDKFNYSWEVQSFKKASNVFNKFFAHGSFRRKFLRMGYKGCVSIIRRIQNINFFWKKSRLIMTLLVRDEIDIIEKNIKYHLSHGVDFIIATDNGSKDGTREILLKYEKEGLVHLIDEPGNDHSQSKWVNRMAEIAINEYGADAIFHCDADEFWSSEKGDIKRDILSSEFDVMSVDVVNVLMENKEGGEIFPQDAKYAVINPLSSSNLKEASMSKNFYLFKYPPKVIFKTKKGLLRVGEGNHSVIEKDRISRCVTKSIKIYHFPLRGKKEFFEKVIKGGSALEANKYLSKNVGWHWRRWFESYKNGQLDRDYSKLTISKKEADDLRRRGVIEDFKFKHFLTK